MIKLISLLLLALIFTQNISAQQYSIKDLEVLVKNRQYNEFLDHVLDILPAQRKEKWNNLTREVASILAMQIINKRKMTRSEFDKMIKISKLSSLRNHLTFTTLKTDITPLIINLCRGEKARCYQDFYEFWISSTPEPQFASSIIETINRLGLVNSFLNKDHIFMTNLFYHALDQKKRCSVKELLNPLKDYFEQMKMAQQLGEYDKLITVRLSKNCFDKSRIQLNKWLLDQRYSNAEFSYYLLDLKNALSQGQTDLFLTRFFIEKTENGKYLNLAWNILRDIKNDYKRRIKVTQSLKIIDPLPDKIFQYSQSKRKRVLIDHLTSSLPEYIQYYLKSCEHYYLGKQIFPKGNPVINCRSLLPILKKQGLFSRTRIEAIEATFRTL